MTIKWLALIIASLLSTLWIVYLAFKAFNGILYEIGLTKAYMERIDAEE